MAKSVLDLYELYKLVIARGGLVNVINKKLWQEIIKDLNLPSSITSAAFTLRTQYTKYLYPYECEKYNLSSESELQAAIENNKRDGSRRSTSNYNQFSPQSPQTPHHQQLQMVSRVYLLYFEIILEVLDVLNFHSYCIVLQSCCTGLRHL